MRLVYFEEIADIYFQILRCFKVVNNQYFTIWANQSGQPRRKGNKKIGNHKKKYGIKKMIEKKKNWSIGIAESANASFVHPRDPGSNLGTDRKYFLILFVCHLNQNQ